MSFQLIPGGLWVLPPFTNPNGSGGSPAVGVANLTMQTAATRVAMVFLAPRDGNLKSFEFKMGAVTQNPVNGLKVSFQGVNAQNKPDNSIDQFRVVATGSIVAQAWIAPGIISDDGTDGGNLRAVVAGEPVAFVIEFNTFVAGDSLSIPLLSGDTSSAGNLTWMAAHATRSTDSGASYTADVRPMSCALLYDDDTYENINPNVFPILTTTTLAFNSGSTPDEVGMRFILPFDFELAGIWCKYQAGASAPSDLKLYSADDTVLDTITISPTTMIRGTSMEGIYIPMSRFSPCQGGAVHRITFTPTTANNITIDRFTVNSNAILRSVGGGVEFYRTARTNAGSWVDTDTERPWLGLQLSRLNAVASGGGGKAVYLS